MNGAGRHPWWFTVLIVLAAAPMLLFPGMETAAEGQMGTLMWLFPVYMVIASVCAWVCYPDRRELAWILLALMALSDIGVIMTSGL